MLQVMEQSNAGDYTLAEVLGKGSFGEVRRAIAPDGRIVATKIIELDTFVQIEDVAIELTLLRSLTHENIVEVVDSFLVKTSLWICMEFCAAGSMWTMLRGFKRLSEEESRYVLHETVKGLAFIHRNNILHRDIKSANVLVTAKGEIKLADFGVGAQLVKTMEERRSFMGTAFWMAPEVIQGEPYSKPVDIWSIGIFAIELICGRTPHAHLQAGKALSAIVTQEPPNLRSLLRHSGHVSEAYYDLTEICLQRDPKLRLTAFEVQNHPALAKSTSPSASFLSKVRALIDRAAVKSAEYQAAQAVQEEEVNDNMSDSSYWSLSSVENLNSGQSQLEDCDSVMKPAKSRAVASKPTTDGKKKKDQHVSSSLDDPRILKAVFAGLITGPLIRTSDRARNPDIRRKINAITEALVELDTALEGFSRTLVEETCLAVHKFGPHKF